MFAVKRWVSGVVVRNCCWCNAERVVLIGERRLEAQYGGIYTYLGAYGLDSMIMLCCCNRK